MRIARTIPPTAAPISWRNLIHAFVGVALRQQYMRKFERELASFVGVNHVFLVNSGKAALTIICNALRQVSDRKKVIIPAYTCFSVPSAIVKAGLEIVLCDVDETSLDFDAHRLKELLTEEVLCIVPNHLFGRPANLTSLQALCRSKGIYIVEDAAQSMGVTVQEGKLGAIGDIGFYSLGRGKNLSALSGGVIVTNSNRLGALIRAECESLPIPPILENVRQFIEAIFIYIFVAPWLYWLPSSLPFLRLGETIFYSRFPITSLSGVSAGLLWGWKERLERANVSRRNNAEYYFQRLGLLPRDSIAVPYLRLPLFTKNKEAKRVLLSRSIKIGLGLSAMYPSGIHEIRELKQTFIGQQYPGAQRVADTMITIPTHQLLGDADKGAICQLLDEFDCLSSSQIERS